MRFLKYLSIIGIVVVAAAVAAVTTGGVELPGRLPFAGRPALAGTTRVAVVAPGAGEVAAYDSSEGGGIVETFRAETEYGTPMAFGVLAEGGDRIEVRLPGRPNGRVGFVDRSAVTVSSVDSAVEVDLGARHLRVTRGGQSVLEAEIAVGSDEFPTPSGDFYVTDVIRSDDPAYGDWAFGISAWSEELTDFNGGSGQIGLHGTSDPDSIGQDVSHGCVRVHNDVAMQLSELIEVGTPVSIH